ncbi:transporter substrate-binding domain-containing protein [Pigmentibacter sp. JX0631]|uniref:substrate-binding periplasmic protein n=1 Tax=Pigmentibacter sp. JX0631 TaxID=2976982 RepID=UPI002469C0D5|nr:transporter substrate-binding domain-containing protein [Pigmentibacter sp. JX0631]WGL59617.1 transporter substrate-binding domain-containing protein [Pigmentibacter sp. JX0631]
MKKLILFAIIFNFIGFNSIYGQELIGFTEELPGLIELDGDQLKGPIVDKVRKIFKKANLKENLKVYPWARSYEMAKREKNYFVFPMAKNAEREKYFNFVGVLFHINTYLYQKTESIIKIKTLEEAKKYSICVVRNDVRDQYLTEKNFPNIVRFSDQSEAIHGLIAKKCDFAICAENIEYIWKKNVKENLNYLVKKSFHVKEINGERYLSISKQTDAEIINKLVLAMKEINK